MNTTEITQFERQAQFATIRVTHIYNKYQWLDTLATEAETKAKELRSLADTAHTEYLNVIADK